MLTDSRKFTLPKYGRIALQYDRHHVNVQLHQLREIRKLKKM